MFWIFSVLETINRYRAHSREDTISTSMEHDIEVQHSFVDLQSHFFPFFSFEIISQVNFKVKLKYETDIFT